jgi:simple sugar transport system substrate-binding protein
MKVYLTAHPETRGIVCWDSLTGSAAARAKADVGMDIPVLSWNLDSVTIGCVKEGELTMTLSQQPYLQAYYTVVALYLKLRYGFLETPFVDPGRLLVDRSNIGQVEELFNQGVLG